LKQLFLFVALLFTVHGSYAQSILNKTVSVNITRQPLGTVLDNIGSQGDFHFSYIKDFIRDDSLVTIKASRKTVKQILDMLFQGSCQYKEIGNQLILQRAGKEKWYFVSGYITDAMTGKPVSNASIYERMQLISTMTNEQGFFRIKLREKDQITAITVSKDLYKDTAMIISSGRDQEMRASIKPSNPILLSIVDVNQFSHVEQTWLGNFFLSSRQRMQSLNLSEFFTKQPYQSSIIPGLGTHGKLGSQVVNKVSLNMIGGYTAGLHGFELASIFNIDQKDVKYLQAAGVFNIVGGKFRGMQLAGLHNHVLDSLNGLQAAGISNVLKGSLKGVQLAGIVNHVKGNNEGMQAAGIGNISEDSAQGAQLAGIFNYTKNITGFQAGSIINYTKGISGVQISGVGNITTGTVEGVQAAGVFNYAKKLKGVQIGVVNIADSSDGYSIGIFNLVMKNGYHRLDIYSDEMLDVNLAWKSGNRKLYTIFLAGTSLNSKEKAYSFGFGLGHSFHLSKKVSIEAEYISQTVYLGSWKYSLALNRFQPVLNIKLAKNITLFGGPSFTTGYQEAGATPVAGYKSALPGRYNAFKMGDNVSGWFGWHAGIGFF
jgi:hypothetical protein